MRRLRIALGTATTIILGAGAASSAVAAGPHDATDVHRQPTSTTVPTAANAMAAMHSASMDEMHAQMRDVMPAVMRPACDAAHTATTSTPTTGTATAPTDHTTHHPG